MGKKTYSFVRIGKEFWIQWNVGQCRKFERVDEFEASSPPRRVKRRTKTHATPTTSLVTVYGLNTQIN
jgi:hypothetical protein